MTDVDVALDAHADLGEGPSWLASSNRLVWVDIHKKQVHLFDPGIGEDKVLKTENMPGAIVGRASGGALLATTDGFHAFDLETGATELLVAVEEDNAKTRMNDGKCDPSGRFFGGTMGFDADEGAGSFYRLDPDLTVTKLLEGVTISNGMGWSPDRRTMYYIDTPTRRVDAFDYDLSDGAVTNRRPLFDIPSDAGMPDGMTVDADGGLWVCLWGGSAVNRYTPAGDLDRVVQIPAPNVTSCCFGGADLTDLFITTASAPLDEAGLKQYPHAGGLFHLRPGVSGQPSYTFAG